jgi:RND family efflux transporter MFP subunit
MKPLIKWSIVGIAVLAIALPVGRTLLAKRSEKQAQAQAAQAPKAAVALELTAGDVLTLQNQNLSQGLPVSGALRAANWATVKARVAGELQGLQLREGDSVKAGQTIARIDSTEYNARLSQARQQADAAKAQIDIAQRQFDNNKALVDQGFISKTALDTSQANLNAAKANHQAALAARDVAQKSLDDTVLRAPISGQVSQRLAQNGERVGVDARVLEIMDLSRLELEAAISAQDAATLRVGQAASLSVEGVSAPVQAVVVRINPSAQAGSRAVLVYLSVKAAPEQQASLRHGLFAQGVLQTGTQQTPAVPLNAVRTDKPAPYVQVIAGSQVKHQNVELGARGDVAGQTWVAVKGLPDGSAVLSGAVGLVREGTPVKLPSQSTNAASAAPAAKAAASAQ